MLNIKAFMTHKRQVNNNVGAVATFGELSTYARTFSKDVGLYSLVSEADLELNVFFHNRNGAHNGLVATPFVNLIFDLTKWMYTRSTTLTQATSKTDLLNEFLNAFHGKIMLPDIGEIKTGEGRTMPVWFSFEAVGYETNRIKIWLSSQAFERDYDEYEITVVSPLTNIDILFAPVPEIRNALAGVSLSDQMEKVQTIKNRLPETILRAETINYINPTDPNIEFPTNWFVIIYGPKGNNSEAIKNAITAHILKNSKEPESAWKQIMPFLFKITRMYILPQWQKMAIPNRIATVGIYSPVSSPKDILSQAKTKLNHLPTAFIESHLQVTHHKYRAITLSCCGGVDNAQNKYKLTDYFPDYIGEGTPSMDFNRMTENTKAWTVLMEEMLVLAEDPNLQAIMPVHTRSVTIGATEYIGRRFMNVEFLVAIKT